MKRFAVAFIVLLLAGFSFAQDEIVNITSFEEEAATPFTGGQTSFSMIDQINPDDNVAPLDGDWHLLMEYDTSIDNYGMASVTFPEPVDITGMREIHVWAYFLPDAQPHPDAGYSLRMSLDGDIDIALGDVQKYPVSGEWLEYVWEIDSLSSQNDLSAMTGFNMCFMPGAASAIGVCYIDKIYATRPADFPDALEYVQVYSFDEEGDNFAPVGWQSAGGDVFTGFGDVEPSEGENYMEIMLGEWWVQEARTTDAKGASDLWAQATDIVMDVRVSEDFTGSWLLLNPVVQSGGEDADGNPLEPVNSWDTYGERDIRWSFEVGTWFTIAWPFRADLHRGALGDYGWFQIVLVTNQDAAEAGKSIYIDNFRLAAPSQTKVPDWSVFE
ncbi:MAG: hypothetical protein JXR73_16315 [Candidatus Omnitrophica bacterium]|nr:hypothetical protein [Candidatus Omnitrophota bacterium]